MRRSTLAILAAALVTLTACATSNAPPASPTGSPVAALPTHPVEFVISTAPGARQRDGAVFRRIEDTMKTKPFTDLSQTSGATVAAALAGHQGGVVATVNNPSEGLPLYQGTTKQLKPLCAFTPESPKTGVY